MAFTHSSDEDVKAHENGHVEGTPNQLEVIRTVSRVPGNPNYYEKNGLRTEGDGLDHNSYNTVSTARRELLLKR